MLSDVLAFDLRVYDPGAPLFGEVSSETVLEPTDPGWTAAYIHSDNMDNGSASGAIGNRNGTTTVQFPFVGQGAFVDLGYGYDARRPPAFVNLPSPVFAAAYSSSAVTPWFFVPHSLIDPFLDARAAVDKWKSQLAPGYAVYDTWSFHYENDGLDEDKVNGVDQGTNGLDERDPRLGGAVDAVDNALDVPINGPDDVGERETTPPYDKPLRAVQVVLRLYETDSRQIRQTSVNQSFVPE